MVGPGIILKKTIFILVADSEDSVAEYYNNTVLSKQILKQQFSQRIKIFKSLILIKCTTRFHVHNTLNSSLKCIWKRAEYNCFQNTIHTYCTVPNFLKVCKTPFSWRPAYFFGLSSL